MAGIYDDFYMYGDPFDNEYDDYDESSDRYGDNDSYGSDYAWGRKKKEDAKSYGEDDSCCFEHTSHSRELLAELNNQRQTRDFFDVVVKVQGRRFRCHRAVLASTPFFKAMLSSHLAERKSKVVELQEIDPSSFSKILDFLYTGKICIRKDDVQDILQAAHMLQIEKITQYCQEFVEDNLCLSNCIGVMRLANMYGFSDLAETARNQALSHFSEKGKKEEFLSLSVEELLDLLTDEDLHVTNEEEVVDSVIRWLDHDPESRRTAIVAIFQEIRLLSMRVSALMKLESHPVVQDYPECLAKITAAKAKHLASTQRATANEEAEADEDEVKPRLGTSDDLAILVGGWRIDEGMTRYDELLPLQSVICLDPASEQCYRVTDLPTAISGYMSVARAERHLYVTGGRSHPLVGEQVPHSAPSWQAFRYDFPTDTWTKLPDMPRGRAGHRSAVVDGKLFLVGGDTDDTPAFSMDCYDLEEETWISINPHTLPGIDPSSDLTVTACGSNLVAVELFDNTEESHSWDENRKLRVHRFDVKTAHWLCSEVPVRGYSKTACVLTAVRENVHILLQHRNVDPLKMFAYDVEKGTLSKLEDKEDWTGTFCITRCGTQYTYMMYEEQIHQKDLADSIIYSKFVEDNQSISSSRMLAPCVTLDLSFVLIGHSLLATQKSTIGWYCRDLELLSDNEEDETSSSD